MNRLFTSFKLRDVTFKNRIFVSPMCQYSCRDGMPTDWHMVHLGSRAAGGAGLVMIEATAVSPEGRISPFDTGIWNDTQAEAFKPMTAFIKSQGSIAGIQIAHAGRKASTDSPWHGGGTVTEADGGWQPIGPSPLPFSDTSPTPRQMSTADIEQISERFEEAADRALQAGFEVLELHMAHGYLLHEFLSPLSNRRTDAYGGSLENRMRLPLTVAQRVRQRWPAHLPLFVRISCTDWVSQGWDLAQSILFCKELKALGVDLIDCSSAALVPYATIPVAPGFQVPFATAIRKDADIATGAVGLITSPVQADQIIATDQADAVLLGREMLRDPYWPLHAAKTLGVDVAWPKQYERAK